MTTRTGSSTDTRETTGPGADGQQISATFDGIGEAEYAVRRLHAIGFGRGDVALSLEQTETRSEESPAPASLATPYALATSLMGGAAAGVLSAVFAPHTTTIGGFGWSLPTALLFALAGGTFGWLLGGITGFGAISQEEREDSGEPVATEKPVPTVSVVAGDRSEEVRALLGSVGARSVSGGSRVQAGESERRAAEAAPKPPVYGPTTGARAGTAAGGGDNGASPPATRGGGTHASTETNSVAVGTEIPSRTVVSPTHDDGATTPAAGVAPEHEPPARAVPASTPPPPTPQAVPPVVPRPDEVGEPSTSPAMQNRGLLQKAGVGLGIAVATGVLLRIVRRRDPHPPTE